MNFSMFTSPQFKFVVEDIPIYIHADLVSRHSEPLDRTMSGGWAEQHAGFAVLEGVDKDTFLRFAQWAYNGYYTAASFTVDEKAVETTTATRTSLDMPTSSKDYSSLEDFDPIRLGFKKDKKCKKARDPTSKSELQDSFKNLSTTVRRDSIAIAPPRANQNEQENYTEVFLCHAKMYVFAGQKMIQPLQTLAKEELQLTLANFTLYEHRTGDIIALLRYIYEMDSNGDADVDELRTLMSHYVGFEMDTLIKDVEFKRLMSEDRDGALLGDFLKMVEKRL